MGKADKAFAKLTYNLMLNSLAQIPDLTVIARTSSFTFKGSEKEIQEIANEIGLVDYWDEFGWPDICHQLDNGDFVCD